MCMTGISFVKVHVKLLFCDSFKIVTICSCFLSSHSLTNVNWSLEQYFKMNPTAQIHIFLKKYSNYQRCSFPLKPASYFLRMWDKFWRHIAALAAKVSQELNIIKLLRFLCGELVQQILHLQSQEIWTIHYADNTWSWRISTSLEPSLIPLSSCLNKQLVLITNGFLSMVIKEIL